MFFSFFGCCRFFEKRFGHKKLTNPTCFRFTFSVHVVFRGVPAAACGSPRALGWALENWLGVGWRRLVSVDMTFASPRPQLSRRCLGLNAGSRIVPSSLCALLYKRAAAPQTDVVDSICAVSATCALQMKPLAWRAVVFALLAVLLQPACARKQLAAARANI